MDPTLYMAAMTGNLSYLETIEVISDLHKELTPCEETILHVATEFHQTEFAKKALHLCPRLLLLANSSGDTALHVAAGEGHEDFVEFFIDYLQSSDIETGEYKDVTRMVNLKKDTALHCAARIGSEGCVKLLAEADPEVCSFVNNDDESPLYLFVASGSWNKRGIIIINNLPSSSSASHRGPKALNALHASVLLKLHLGYGVEAIELLVKWRKEMIREGDDLGMTPFHYVAYYGGFKAVELFLKYDSTAIYLLNKNGESALHLAAYNGRVKILQQLLKFRHDCYNMVDKKGRTVLHAAVLGNEKETVEFLLMNNNNNNTQGLISRLINKVDKDGNTALHLAASFKFIDIIQIISSNTKVRFDILNNDLFTPFQLYKQHIPESIQEYYLRYFKLKEVKGGVRTMHENANTHLKRIGTKEGKRNAMKETSTNNNENLDNEMSSELEVNLLVAVLVATVTFAAGFTLPGGLVSEGEDEGLAILTNKPAFKAFIIFNSIAFYCSIFVVGFHFVNTKANNNFIRLVYKEVVKPFTTRAILSMALAFCCGTYVMLRKSAGLSVVPFIIMAYFLFILAYLFPSRLLIRSMTMVQHPIDVITERIKKKFPLKINMDSIY